METETRILPALGAGETYTDPDFLLVQTTTDDDGESVSVIDRMFAAKREDDTGSWVCKTVVDKTKMSHCTALATAKVFAQEHQIPVIYHQHDDLSQADTDGADFLKPVA